MFGAAAVETFMGLPSQSVAGLTADIALIGVPCATPYASVGAYCAGAPGAIRTAMAGYAPALAHHDFDFDGPLLGAGLVKVADCGDIACIESDAAANRGTICSTIATILDRGAVPIVIGGDDSVPIPIFSTFAGRGKFTVVQLDAHIDWRDEVGGERLGLSSTMRRASEMGHIERIVQVGQRGLGSARPQDYQAAVAAGVAFVPARDVHAHGVQPVLDRIPSGARVLLSVDCDALDPAIMPAVIAPAPGGLTYWQTIDMLHSIAAKAQIACFDLVEFMPERDVAQLGAAHAGRILIHAIGLIARQFNTRLAYGLSSEKAGITTSKTSPS
jgi:agmatinase